MSIRDVAMLIFVTVVDGDEFQKRGEDTDATCMQGPVRN